MAEGHDRIIRSRPTSISRSRGRKPRRARRPSFRIASRNISAISSACSPTTRRDKSTSSAATSPPSICRCSRCGRGWHTPSRAHSPGRTAFSGLGGARGVGRRAPEHRRLSRLRPAEFLQQIGYFPLLSRARPWAGEGWTAEVMNPARPHALPLALWLPLLVNQAFAFGTTHTPVELTGTRKKHTMNPT